MADLRDWRQGQRLSLDKVAGMLGLSGQNPARTIQRVETGESLPDADLAAALTKISDGAVTPVDLHLTRLAWLRESGRARAFGPEPELFDRRPDADTNATTVADPAAPVIAQDEKVCP